MMALIEAFEWLSGRGKRGVYNPSPPQRVSNQTSISRLGSVSPGKQLLTRIPRGADSMWEGRKRTPKILDPRILVSAPLQLRQPLSVLHLGGE
jgi:hypothetical protein